MSASDSATTGKTRRMPQQPAAALGILVGGAMLGLAALRWGFRGAVASTLGGK